MFPFFIPCMIAVNKSLRMSVLFGSFLMMVSAVLKCIIGKPSRVKSGTRTDIVPCVRQQQEHNNTNNTSTATSVVLV